MMPVIRMFVTMPMVVIHNAHRGNILGIFCNKQLKRILAPGPAKFFSLFWLAHLSFWVKEGDTPKLHLFAILRLVQSFIHPCWPEDESFITPWPGGEKYTRDVGNAFEGLIWSRNFLR